MIAAKHSLSEFALSRQILASRRADADAGRMNEHRHRAAQVNLRFPTQPSSQAIALRRKDIAQTQEASHEGAPGLMIKIPGARPPVQCCRYS